MPFKRQMLEGHQRIAVEINRIGDLIECAFKTLRIFLLHVIDPVLKVSGCGADFGQALIEHAFELSLAIGHRTKPVLDQLASQVSPDGARLVCSRTHTNRLSERSVEIG